MGLGRIYSLRVEGRSIANESGTGLLVAAPGSGKKILITDIITRGDTIISTASGGGGTAIAYLGENSVCNFTSPISVPENSDVYSDADFVTLVYHIVSV